MLNLFYGLMWFDYVEVNYVLSMFGLFHAVECVYEKDLKNYDATSNIIYTPRTGIEYTGLFIKNDV